MLKTAWDTRHVSPMYLQHLATIRPKPYYGNQVTSGGTFDARTEHTAALLCRTFFSWSSFAFATASAAFVLMESISTALVCVTSWSSSLRFFIVAPSAPTSWCC